MLVEIHALQNFAPSNLNRDDTGSPKDCMFGDYRRARISSQALKRAVRLEFKTQGLLPLQQTGARTRRIVGQIASVLAVDGRTLEEATAVVRTALGGMGLTVGPDGLTQYLLFAGQREINAITEVCTQRWDALVSAAAEVAGSDAPVASADTTTPARSRSTARAAKKDAKDVVPKAISDELRRALDGGRAADIALFGRMLADMPEKNIDAACQMAHAISTNRVSIEFDYFTAVDDLNPREETGAGMIGTVEFNSACFYRYANVDLDVLTENLQGDAELARASLEAFLRAFISAVPSGKQNSMAAQNPPSFVFTVARERGLWSLTNAFLQPVRPDDRRDLAQASINRLDTYWGQLAAMYGERGILGKWCVALDGDGLGVLAEARQPDVEHLVEVTIGSTRTLASE